MDYIKLAETYDKLEKTTKRLEKTYILSEFMKEIKKSEDIEPIINLLRGSVFPSWDERKIGVSSKIVIKALALSSGNSAEKIEKVWVKTGDLGETASELMTNKKQMTLHSRTLTVKKVYDNIRNLAELEGEGTVNKKLALISELLTSSNPLEAKFITRTVLEDLRTGVGESTIRDGIVWRFFYEELKLDYDPKSNELKFPNPESEQKYKEYQEKIQNSYDLTNDFAEVYKTLMESGIKNLNTVSLKPGKPMNVMLAIKLENEQEALEALGSPVLCDYKLDGFRVQIHKSGDKITLYTRRLENVTNQFKELLPIIKAHIKAESFIVDAEIVGFDPKTHKYLPFQNISQRIKRKYDIEQIAKKIPVEINVFDIMYENGKSLVELPEDERHILLEKIVKQEPQKIVIPPYRILSNPEEIKKFYHESLNAGNEGLMVKSLKQHYVSGRKVGGWIKLKPVLETLDLVITGAEWGTGKRANWLSSFTVACIDKDGNYLDVGKVGTGIKEKSIENDTENSDAVTFEELTELLTPLIISKGTKEVKVKPKIVVEINYEEVQGSPEYSSGSALRFPRIVRLRADKGPDEIATIEEIKKIYFKQRGRKEKKE
jgi:DNA ligase-1